MPRDDGGHAFPGAVPEFIDHPVHGCVHRSAVGMEAEPGMSLRAYIATKAMAAIIAKTPAARALDAAGLPDDIFTGAADGAVRYADALIEKLKESDA